MMTYAFFVTWFLVLYLGASLIIQTILGAASLIAHAIAKKDYDIDLKSRVQLFVVCLTILIVFFYN